MNSLMRRLPLAALPFAFALTATAHAQVSPSATPVPASTNRPTAMDKSYDGRLHVSAAPYLWLPTLRQNVQYTLPVLPRAYGVTTISKNVQVGPSDYLSNLNSGAMFAFDARQGDLEIFGDFIYTNVTTNATAYSAVSGPLGKITIPVTVATSARLAANIWELAAGTSIAHGHNADLNAFAGWRQFPLNLTLGYNATIGKRGILAPSGTTTRSLLANDVIFGLRGKAFLDSHWFAPYYIDMGVGAINQSWQGLAGAGYAFDHGQALLVTYRSLNFYAFPSSSPIQKLSIYGPLVGYTFGL